MSILSVILGSMNRDTLICLILGVSECDMKLHVLTPSMCLHMC